MARLNGHMRDTHARLCSAAIVAMVALALCGCDIFETRDAEAPGSGQTPWEPPDVPSKVFVNLRTGVEDLTGVNYERSLNDNYTLIPHPQDEEALPGKFDGWTKAVELSVLQRIMGDAIKIEVTFTNPELILGSETEATMRAPYIFSITPASGGEVEEYRAIAHFDMIKISAGWQLVKWEDVEFVEGFASFGFLRGSLRQ